MDWVSSEVVSIVYYLMPGFVAAWVFYGLTPHPRSSPFERAVQALIFTVLVQAATVLIRGVLLWVGGIGEYLSLGQWNENTALVWSVLVALTVGFLFAWCANKDFPHSWLRSEEPAKRTRFAWLRRLQFTTRTSFPSEWFSAFHRERRWVILNLSGERRLFGWPEEWPDSPDAGYFVIARPEWLLNDGNAAPLHRVEKMLVPVGDVELVELLKHDDEIGEPPKDIDEIDQMLTNLHK